MFYDLGLKSFCESYAEVFTNIIKEFYTNMVFNNEGFVPKFLKTSIGGKRMIFSTRDVNALYGCEDHSS